MFLLLLWLLTAFPLVATIIIEVPIEKKLRDDLRNLYGWAARPVQNYTDRLDLFIRFKLTRIADLVMQIFSISNLNYSLSIINKVLVYPYPGP